MVGTLQLRIGGPQFAEVLHLELDHILVEEVQGGLCIRDRKSNRSGYLWDDELRAVLLVGNGPTPQSALMLYALVEAKLGPEA